MDQEEKGLRAGEIASVKILLIGDSGVGKSSLLAAYADKNRFSNEITSTIGIDYRAKRVKIDGKTILAQIWDTAGQERFRTITTAYYRGTHCSLLVFDLSNPKTFEDCNFWLQNIRIYAGDVPVILVGNKMDKIRSDRLVTEATIAAAEAFAAKEKIPLVLLSTKEEAGKTGSKIDQLFQSIIRLGHQRVSARDGALIDIEKQEKKACCSS